MKNQNKDKICEYIRKQNAFSKWYSIPKVQNVKENLITTKYTKLTIGKLNLDESNFIKWSNKEMKFRIFVILKYLYKKI